MKKLSNQVEKAETVEKAILNDIMEAGCRRYGTHFHRPAKQVYLLFAV